MEKKLQMIKSQFFFVILVLLLFTFFFSINILDKIILIIVGFFSCKFFYFLNQIKISFN